MSVVSSLFLSTKDTKTHEVVFTLTPVSRYGAGSGPLPLGEGASGIFSGREEGTKLCVWKLREEYRLGPCLQSIGGCDVGADVALVSGGTI